MVHVWIKYCTTTFFSFFHNNVAEPKIKIKNKHKTKRKPKYLKTKTKQKKCISTVSNLFILSCPLSSSDNMESTFSPLNVFQTLACFAYNPALYISNPQDMHWYTHTRTHTNRHTHPPTPYTIFFLKSKDNRRFLKKKRLAAPATHTNTQFHDREKEEEERKRQVRGRPSSISDHHSDLTQWS